MTIINKDLEDVIESNIGNYSFNINLFRSFPNCRDGFKTVNRRILFGLHEMKLTPGVQHRKVAAVVGKVLGDTHPHGDASVSDALVKMSQDFYMNEPIVDVSGNNGSISGDPAAAMRYIECRMTKYGKECLEDLEKNAVNWKPNYDGSLLEPETLPVKYPNLIINGGYGIGQAYISSIPSHNFNEVIDILIKLIKNPNLEIDEIANKLIPDYPTGGIIINKSELPNAYKTGVGNIKIRAKIAITANNDLLITEIPYMTTTGAILDKIQAICKDERIDGIADIVDQTNEKNGIKILIKIKRGYDPASIEKQLYELTPLQSTLLFSLIATDGTQFRQYNILELFNEWIEYRKTTLKRIFNFNMSKIRRRIHVINGLLTCLADIDEVITLIKKSSDKKDTTSKLMKKYKLTDIQAEAIADLQLYRLSSMSINTLKQEKLNLENELNNYIEYFTKPEKLNQYIIDELEEGQRKYSKERKTTAIDVKDGVVKLSIPDSNHTIFVTKDGFVKKLSLDMKTNATNCQGRSIGKMKSGDVIISSFNANNKDNVLMFTNTGRLFMCRVYDLKDTSLNSYGILVNTYFALKPNEHIVSAITINDDILSNDNAFLIFVTKNGQVKRTMINQYSSASKSGLIAIKLMENDSLIGVKESENDADIIIATQKGGATRFNTDEVSIQLRNASGVIGAPLNEGDSVVSFDIVDTNKTHIFVLDSGGYGKLVEIKGMQAQSRINKCKIIAKLRNEDKLVSLKLVNFDETITMISENNMVKINVDTVPVAIRSASSKPLFKLNKSDKVVDCYIEGKE